MILYTQYLYIRVTRVTGKNGFLFSVGNLILGFLLLVSAVLFLALLPELLAIRLGRVVLNWPGLISTPQDFFRSLPDSSVFFYKAGADTRNFIKVSFSYLRISFLYMTAAGIISLAIGIPAGIKASGTGGFFSRIILRIVDFLGSLPDFITFIILQILVILFKELTGVRLVRIASAGINPALALPLTAMTIYPLLYIIRITAEEMGRLRGENFILVLKGRGIPPARIYVKHLLPGIFRLVRRELPGVFGIIIASLFIAERIFNLTRITRFLFSYAFESVRGILIRGAS